MFDAMKMLGGLLGNNAFASGVGGQVMRGLVSGRSGRSTTAGVLGTLAVAAIQHYAQRRSSSSETQIPFQLPGSQDMSNADIGADANGRALLLVRAMVNAAKADGHIDNTEKERIFQRLPDLEPEELSLIREEMARPVDAAAFANEVPPDMALEVYRLSLMAIRVDSFEEAVYLRELAERLGIDSRTVNDIHDQLGINRLFDN